MRRPLFRLLAATITLGVAAISGTPAGAQSLDVLQNPLPQAYLDSCQSYALGIAMVRAGVPGYRLDKPQDARTIEQEVRGAIQAEVKPGESIYSHAVWKRAVGRLTSNGYALNSKTFDTPAALLAEIAAKTGITAAKTLGVLSLPTSKTPVLTSFTRIGKNTYKDGHIVTVLGLDVPTGPVSAPTSALLLNSAVKKSKPGAPVAYVPLCAASGPPPTLPGDIAYTGAVRLEADYVLKSWDGKYIALWISKR